MPLECRTGCGNRALLKRPKTGDALCKECFFRAFETEIHVTIKKAKLFKPGEKVAVAVSDLIFLISRAQSS
jgi:cytoplasmic tRNA 2-thiolation protein 1